MHKAASLGALGRFSEALAELEAVYPAAEALGDVRVLGGWRLLAARTMVESAQLQRARSARPTGQAVLGPHFVFGMFIVR